MSARIPTTMMCSWHEHHAEDAAKFEVLAETALHTDA